MKERILFVCLGNICRSPAADGIMHRMVAERGLAEQLEIDSAGTYGGHAGELPDARMRRAAATRGYELTHRSRKFCESDFEDFDRIVVMDDMNYEDVRRKAPSRQAEAQIYRMADFCRSYPDCKYIPDPYYEGHEGFERVLDLLEDGCRHLLAEIEQK